MLAGHVIGGAAWAFWSALNRVSASEVAGSTIGVPIGQELTGPVARLIGAEQVLGISTVVGVVGCCVLLAVPAIRGPRRVTPASA